MSDQSTPPESGKIDWSDFAKAALDDLRRVMDRERDQLRRMEVGRSIGRAYHDKPANPRLEVRGSYGYRSDFYGDQILAPVTPHDIATVFYYDRIAEIPMHKVNHVVQRWKDAILNTGHAMHRPRIEQAVDQLYTAGNFKVPKIEYHDSIIGAAYAARHRDDYLLHGLGAELSFAQVLVRESQRDIGFRTAIMQALLRISYLHAHPLTAYFWPSLAIYDLMSQARLFSDPRIDALITLALETGGVIVTESTCFIADRPIGIDFDERNRLHHDKLPAVRWAGGDELHYYRGIPVPEQVIERPNSITYEQIMTTQNQEVRRVMVERYGMERFVRDSGAVKVAEDGYCALWRKNEPREPVVVAEFVNSTPEPDGTFKHYFIRIDPRAYDGDASCVPQAAAASTWRKPSGTLLFPRYQEYRVIQET